MSRVGYDNTVGVLEGGFESWKKANKEFENTGRITVEELESKLEESETLLIDVRKKSEFDSEHVLGAINIPLNEINQHLSEFPKNKPFIVHCAGGYRSMIASSILKQRGWNDFVDVVEGFDEIKESNIKNSEYKCPTTLL